MKSFILILILTGCGLFYVRSQQPDLWNQLLARVGMQTTSLACTPDTPPTAAVVPPPTEPITPVGLVPVRTEVITPDSTYMTSEHVRQVVQPVQPGAAPQPATASATPTSTTTSAQ